jgi:hypothetical protein
VAKKLPPIRLGEQGQDDLDVIVRQIIEEHIRAQAQLESLAVRALLSGQLGVLRFRRRSQREVDATLKKLEDAIGRPVPRLVRQAFKLGSRIADRGLPQEELPSGLSRVDENAVNILTDNLTNRLGDAATTIGRREEDLFRREGLKIAAAHLTREDPIPTATTQLVRALAEEGVTSFEDKLGRRWNLDTYAEMVVRTTTSEAIFQGTQTQMLARGFDLVQVNQVVGACPQCIPFENKVFSLTGRADGFPRLKITFPIHPQCRHFIFPAPEAVEERRQALGVVA